MFNVQVYARSNGSWNVARPENPRYKGGNFNTLEEAQDYAARWPQGQARVIKAR